MQSTKIWTILRLTLIGAALALTVVGQTSPKAPNAIIEQTEYWALPGKADEVYLWRIHACDVRETLGLPRGRVLRRQGDSDTLPDVIWQIEYPNDAARDHDLKVREAPEFTAVRDHMNTLTRRFERSFWQPAQ